MLAGSFLEGNKDRTARALLIGLIWRLFRCCRSSYAVTPIARTENPSEAFCGAETCYGFGNELLQPKLLKRRMRWHAGLSSRDKDDDALCGKDCPRERVCDICH